jgi:DNA mismatch repair ATPase MutS
MRVLLMHRDKDFDLGRALPAHHQDLVQDLELERLFDAMAAGDAFLRDVARKAVFASLREPEEIAYRQHVLQDCMAQPALIRDLYAIAVEAVEGERKIFRSSFWRYPDSILSGAVDVLQMLVGLLKRLRAVADAHAGRFRSEGFAAFFGMLTRELDDTYLRRLDEHLRQLRFRHGVRVSARLGQGNKGIGYVLRRPPSDRSGWKLWMSFFERASPYTIVIADRDETGMRALSELRGRGINLVANAVAQSTDHILRFFAMLRAELGFYVGCLNLWHRLAEKSEPVCLPEPQAPGRPLFACRGLYDVCLSLCVEGRVVGNEVDADEKLLVMITGANQGGKSTFLRSVGLAQLMMQAGMPVGAVAFRASVGDALFTHYRREEDPTMKSGKLDEELGRMREVVNQLTPNSIVLFNESFSATNEREGAEIGGGIVRALLETGVRVFFVTHSFELADGFYRQGMAQAVFLRAERHADGTRTFKVVEGEPLPTSYGPDLYARVFGETAGAVATAPRA